MDSQKPIAYPMLPPTLLLLSLKTYFSPQRTLSYLHAILDPSNAILPPIHLRTRLLFSFIPDFLSIYPCHEIIQKQSGALSEPYKQLQSTSSSPRGSVDQSGATGDSLSFPDVLLGAQDCFWETDLGPYTGEVSPTALKSLGVSIVELGHAERRKFFKETNEQVAAKAAAASSLGIVPLICIGEISEPPKEGPMSMAIGNALREMSPQITSALESLGSSAPAILAYEPVWAIGAPKPAEVSYIGPIVSAIRDVIKSVEQKSGRTGPTRVVYGGSAGPGLWKDKGLGECVDGMFLGRFAHKIDGLRSVVAEVVESIENK
ncbi:MAG: hypothetical protein Q9160_004240 [Pyrenula sp. 1 TL-2023]